MNNWLPIKLSMELISFEEMAAAEESKKVTDSEKLRKYNKIAFLSEIPQQS